LRKVGHLQNIVNPGKVDISRNNYGGDGMSRNYQEGRLGAEITQKQRALAEVI
jgi:hypothetical protein